MPFPQAEGPSAPYEISNKDTDAPLPNLALPLFSLAHVGFMVLIVVSGQVSPQGFQFFPASILRAYISFN
jgi:hypothetical protein